MSEGHLIKSLPPLGRNIDDWLLDGELDRCTREKLLRSGSNGGAQPERYCQCDEMIIDGVRVPCPPQHDCAYVEARSALVVEASRIATEKVGNPLRDGLLGRRWTTEFNKIMDRLAAPLLRQSGNGAHEHKAP